MTLTALSPRRFWFVVVAATLAAALLRLPGLRHQALWEDEGYSMLLAHRSPAAIIEGVRQDVHPPGYYLLLHGWMGLFGCSVVACRSLSVLAGVATVPLVALLGAALAGRTAGAVAALLLAFSPLHMYYSQEIRMYSLVTALCALSAWALNRSEGPHASLRPFAGEASGPWWPGRGKAVWPPLALSVLAAAAACWTHYIAWLWCLAQFGGLCLLGQGRRGVARALLGLGGVLVLTAPWLPSLVAQQQHLHHILDRPHSPGRVVASYLVLLVGYAQTRSAFHFGGPIAKAAVALGGLLLGAFAALGWRSLLRSHRPAAVWLACLVVIPPLALYLFSIREGVFLTYVLLPVCVPLLIAVAAGCAALGPRVATAAAAGVLLVSSISLAACYTLPMCNRGTALREVADLLRDRVRPGDVVCHEDATTQLPVDAYLMAAQGEPPRSLLVQPSRIAPGWDYWRPTPSPDRVFPWLAPHLRGPEPRNLWFVAYTTPYGEAMVAQIARHLGPPAERKYFAPSLQTGPLNLVRWRLGDRRPPPPTNARDRS